MNKTFYNIPIQKKKKKHEPVLSIKLLTSAELRLMTKKMPNLEHLNLIIKTV